jgi:hypothetical protein
LGFLRGYILAVDDKLTFGFIKNGNKGVDGSGLPRTIRAEKSKDAPLVYGEADIVYRCEVSVFLCEIFYFDDGS